MTMRHLFLLATAIVFAGVLKSPVHAQITKCTDANGRVSFSDKPCSGSGKAVLIADEDLSGTFVKKAANPTPNQAGQSLTQYQLVDANGNVQDVSKSEFDAQMRENAINKKKAKRIKRQQAQQAANDLPTQCFKKRDQFTSIKGNCSRSKCRDTLDSLRTFLKAKCGGV